MLIGVWVLINQGRIRFNFFRILNGPRQRAKEAQAEGQRGLTEAVGVAKEDQRGVTENRRSHTELLQSLYRAYTEPIQSLYRAYTEPLCSIQFFCKNQSSVFNFSGRIDYLYSISLTTLIDCIQFLWPH